MPVSCSADKSLKIWQCYRPGNTLGVWVGGWGGGGGMIGVSEWVLCGCCVGVGGWVVEVSGCCVGGWVVGVSEWVLCGWVGVVWVWVCHAHPAHIIVCAGVHVEGKNPKWCCVCTLSGYHTREVYDVAW